MSNLNLLSFVNENVAAAVNCVTENKIDVSNNKTTQNVLFYNVGASYTQATLVRFSNLVRQIGIRNETVQYVNVNI